MMDLLNFAFSSFFVWLGCLIYLVCGIGALGMSLGLAVELFLGK